MRKSIIALLLLLPSCGSSSNATYKADYKRLFNQEFDFTLVSGLVYSPELTSSHITFVEDKETKSFLNDKFALLTLQKNDHEADHIAGRHLFFKAGQGDNNFWSCYFNDEKLLIKMGSSQSKVEVYYSSTLSANWANEVASKIESIDSYYSI